MHRTVILWVISVARRRFRNSAIHRWKVTNVIYRMLLRSAVTKRYEVVEFRGSRLLIDTQDITVAPTILSGEYESFELDILGALLKPGMTVVDVGAHIGVYSVMSSRMVGPSGSVWAVEPIEENAKLLQANLLSNNCTNVSVVRAAASDSSGHTRIYLAHEGTGAHSRHPLSGDFVEVVTTTLDELLHDLPVQLIKIDVEGFEASVLLGAQHMITRHRPLILMEFIPELLKRSPQGPEEVLSFLRGNYSFVYAIDEARRTVSICDPEEILRVRATNLLASSVSLSDLLSVV